MKQQIRLTNTVRKNGFVYQLLDRTEYSAIYEQIDPVHNNKVVGYEVFKILIQNERKFEGKIFPSRERFPSNEDFGKTAWSINNYSRACNKYVAISEANKNTVRSSITLPQKVYV